MTAAVTLHRVTMNLTKRDIQAVENLERKFNSRSKAQAVSSALALSASIIDMLDIPGNELVYRPKGSDEYHRVVITGLS
jgi:hypothetical protein